jgi:hypothetical protein
LGLVTLTLLLKHIELHFQVSILATALQVSDYLQQLQPNKFIPQSVSILQLRRGDNQTVYESKKNSPVLICFGLP